MNGQPSTDSQREDIWFKRYAEKKEKVEQLEAAVKKLEQSLTTAQAEGNRARDRLKAIESERDLEVQRHSREKAKFIERIQSEQSAAMESRKKHDDLVAEVARDAKTVEAMAVHANLETPRPENCKCLACQLRITIEEREARNADLRKKNRELKEDLAGFRGPPSKR